MRHHRDLGVLGFLLLLLLCAPGGANEQAPVFKHSLQNGRDVEHQINLGTVQQTWAYKTFWSRQVDAKSRQPLTITEPLWRRLWNDPVGTLQGKQVLWSQKYVVDCSGRRIGTKFIQSTQPSEESAATPVKAMTWEDLNKQPAVHHAICG